MEVAIGLGRGPDPEKAAVDASRQAKTGLSKPDLVLAFASIDLDQAKVHGALCREFDPRLIIGCSSYAEITPAGVTQGTVAVLLLGMEGLKVSFAESAAGGEHGQRGAVLASQLPTPARDVCPIGLMFTAISTGYENEVLRAIERRLGALALWGGVGCGKYDLGMSHPEFSVCYEYLGPTLSRDGCRIALLQPPQGLRVGFGFEHGWQPVGPEVVVTRAEGHEVFEVDGVPVIDYYRQFVGRDHSDDFFELMIQRYGFALQLEGAYEGQSLLKLPVSCDFKRGCIAYFPGEDLSGRRVRLIQASRAALVEGARRAAVKCREALGGEPPALVLMVSCCTRKKILHSRMDTELSAVRDVFGPDVPVFGFYSGGEIAPFLSRYEEIIDRKRPFSGSFYHATTVGLLALGMKGARVVAAPANDCLCETPEAEARQLREMLAASECTLDSTESFLTNLSRKSYEDGEQLKRQNQIIHRYTPHSVFSQIGENVAKGVYEIADAEFSGSFMFLDVKGFTSFSEDHPAAEVVAALNGLFDPATRLIYECGGDVDKFIGDCIFAAFKSAEEALRCGRKLLVLFAEAKKRGGPFSVRIGVSAGRAVRANLGSSERREYTYIGDAVNLAQRLEDNCAPGRMLISEAVFKKAAVPFSQVERKEILVKNKRKPVVCYECAP